MSSSRSLRDRLRGLGWIAGLPGLVLILGLAAPLLTWQVEGRLASAAAAISAGAGEVGAEPWLLFAVRGRDLAVSGEAPDRAARETALSRLALIPGLRRLVDRSGLVEEASPFVWTASRDAAGHVALGGDRPAEIGPAALAARLTPELPPGTTLRDRARSARGAPPGFLAASAYAVARLGALRPGATARIEDTTLSFSGEAATVADHDALRAAFADPPKGFTMRAVDIVPPTVADFRFGLARARDGGLLLSGHVVSEALRAEIRAAAEGAPVDDRMQTARGLAPGIDPAALAAFAFRISNLLQEGSVTVAEGRVSVAGTALDGQAVPEIEALVRDGRPAGIGPGPVSLDARPLSPYRVVLRRDGESVTLSGHLPDQAARERLFAALRPRFFRERILDRSRTAQGAPSGLSDAIETAVGPLALLERGEVRITDRQVRLSGRSLYRESAARSEADLARRLPAGWRAVVAVDGPGEAPQGDAAGCAADFQAAVQGRVLRFAPGSSILQAAFYPLLDGLAALAKRCPTVRIEVTGHADPAGAAPDKTGPDGAVESTASLDTGQAAPQKAAPQAVKAPAKTPPTDRPQTGRPAERPAKPVGNAGPAPAPEIDLSRQRALAVVEYLLQAGVALDRAVAAPPGPSRPDAAGVGFALRS